MFVCVCVFYGCRDFLGILKVFFVYFLRVLEF